MLLNTSMSSILTQNPISNWSRTCIERSFFSNSQCWACVLPGQRKMLTPIIKFNRWRSYSALDASFPGDSAVAVNEVFMDWVHDNPAISSLYRNENIPKPNQIVLEAQAIVCTGPEQTRPLTEEQAMKVLDTILKSGLQGGVTEGQLLKYLGANNHLSPTQAKTLLEDKDVGFAYVSQREASPFLNSIVGLREHIKKRPPLATSEKVQQFVRTFGKEAMVAGFYHDGYENSLLMLMRRREIHAGLVVKGEEGALSMTTKLRSANASKGFQVNHCSGFRQLSTTHDSLADGFSCESFSVDVNAQDYGIEPTETPRTDRSVKKNVELGLAALSGEKGPAYDRIVLNSGMVDHLLGCRGAEDVQVALQRAREAIDSGEALNRLRSFIKISHKV